MKLRTSLKIMSMGLMLTCAIQTQAGFVDYFNRAWSLGVGSMFEYVWLFFKQPAQQQIKDLECKIVEKTSQVEWQQQYQSDYVAMQKGIEQSLQDCQQPEVVQIRVQGQEGAMCGYHALYNAAQLLEQHSYDLGRLSEALNCEISFDAWQEYIAQQRKDGSDEWLHDSEIDNLMQYDQMQNITVCCDSRMLNSQSEVYSEVINNIKNASPKDTYKQAFILGTMTSPYVKVAETAWDGERTGFNHWITVVVVQESNKRTYYVADSLNLDFRASPCVLDLVKALDGEQEAFRLYNESKKYAPTLQILKQRAEELIGTLQRDPFNEQLLNQLFELQEKYERAGGNWQHDFGKRLENLQ